MSEDTKKHLLPHVPTVPVSVRPEGHAGPPGTTYLARAVDTSFSRPTTRELDEGMVAIVFEPDDIEVEEGAKKPRSQCVRVHPDELLPLAMGLMTFASKLEHARASRDTSELLEIMVEDAVKDVFSRVIGSK